MKSKTDKLKTVIKLIKKAEDGERLPKRQFRELLHTRVKLCKELVDRLFEINRAINFASKNDEYRLSFAEYKKLCNERQEIRQILKEANWDIYNYDI
jgi:hypothetical protein